MDCKTLIQNLLFTQFYARHLFQVLSGVDAYRKVLAEANDSSVVIAAIGFSTNLRDLLQSTEDQYR